MKKILGLTVMGLVVMLLVAPSAFASLVTIDLNSGISYQDEGTTTYDDTLKLKDLDGNWAPTQTGSVINNYYATGSSDMWFDGISANFDLSSVNYSNITSATLWAYIKTGTYSDRNWHHYKLYPGAMNTTNEDSGPLGYAFDHSGYSNGGWINQDVPLSWINSNNLDVSLRLWNASADQVKLVTNVVPEPASMALLGLGILGFGAIKRKKRKK